MSQNLLPFRMQTQECSEWCWAAVVSSIAVFVESPQLPQQCDVVDKRCFDPVFAPSPGCCKAENRCVPRDSHCICNQTSSVGRALDAYGLLVGNPDGQNPSPSDFSAIKQQIDQSSAVVLKLVDRSNPDLVHVMVAYGYSGTDDLLIADPADGSSSHYSYSAFLDLSAGAGASAWRLLAFFTTVSAP